MLQRIWLRPLTQRIIAALGTAALGLATLGACTSQNRGSDSSAPRATVPHIVFELPRSFTAAENTPGGSEIGVLSAQIRDAEDHILGSARFSADDPHFAVHAESGSLTLQPGVSLDFETPPLDYIVEVTAHAPESLPGLPAETVAAIVAVTLPIGIRVQDENYLIAFSSSASLRVSEEAHGTVHAFSATLHTFAADTTTAVTPSPQFLLSDATGAPLTEEAGLPFALTSEGELSAVAALDHETTPAYQLHVTVHAEDAEPVTQRVRVEIIDVTRAIQLSSEGTSSIVFDENDPNAHFHVPFAVTRTEGEEEPVAVADTVADTVAAGDLVTFSLHDVQAGVSTPHAAPFVLREAPTEDETTGSLQLALQDGQRLDFESSTRHYALEIHAEAPEAASVVLAFTVDVGNVADQTIAVSVPSLQRIPEGAAGSIRPWTFSLIDQGSGEAPSIPPAITFALASASPDDGRFAIAAPDALAYAPLDAELAAAYTLELVAHSADGSQSAPFELSIAVEYVEKGTATRPYTIDTLAELQSIATGFKNETLAVALDPDDSLGLHYELTADIDASPTADLRYDSAVGALVTDGSGSDDQGKGFLPIGLCNVSCSVTIFARDENGERIADGAGGYVLDATSPEPNAAPDQGFSGSFDGNGFVIRGLSMLRPGAGGVGLFGVLAGASVRGVVMQGAFARANLAVGMLAGVGTSGSVSASFATGLVRSEGGTAGGLVGAVEELEVSQSFAAGWVYGNTVAGGLAATLKARLSQSFFAGEVHGNTHAGGLVGQNFGSVVHSYAAGRVSATFEASPVGGLVGSNSEMTGNSGTISDSFATASVSGPGDDVGSLLGKDEGTVTRSYRLSGVGKNALGTEITEAALKTLACLASDPGVDPMRAASLFQWDDPADDPDLGTLGCTAETEAAFPWNFGEADALPVINSLVGGALDAAAQRAMLIYPGPGQRTESVISGETASLAAPSVPRADGHAPQYFWQLPSEIEDGISGLQSETVSFTVPTLATSITEAITYARPILLTTLVYDGARVVGVYVASWKLTVSPAGG